MHKYKVIKLVNPVTNLVGFDHVSNTIHMVDFKVNFKEISKRGIT